MRNITMDSMTKTPKIKMGHNMIWVIIWPTNRDLTFLPIHETWALENFVEFYINEVMK